MKTDERRLLGGALVSCALLLGAGLWWQHLNAEPVVNIPAPPKLPEPNAHDYYSKAAKLHSALTLAERGKPSIDPVMGTNGHGPLTPQQMVQQYPLAAKLAWLKKRGPALQILRQGFKCQYLSPPERTFGWAPISSEARSLMRLLQVESHARAEQKDYPGAARSALDILHLGHDIPRGGSLIAALTGYAINAIGRRELRKLLPHLDERTARAVVGRLEEFQVRRVTLAQTLAGEKIMWQATLQTLMRRNQFRSYRGPAKEWRWQDTVGMYLCSKQGVLDNYGRYMDSAIAEAGRPYLRRQLPPVPRDPFHKSVLIGMKRQTWNSGREENDHNMLMVEMALHAYRLKKRRLPAMLNELVPAYLKQVPPDAFGGGEPMRYRRTDKKYLLYSIGPDGKDDGGRAIELGSAYKPTRRHLMQPDSTGDFVSGINR